MSFYVYTDDINSFPGNEDCHSGATYAQIG